MVSDRGEHGDEIITSMCQRQGAEFVEDGFYVGGHWEQPLEIIPVDPLGQESNHCEEVSGARAEFTEGRGSEREFYCRGEAAVMIRSKYLCSLSVPLLSQSIVILLDNNALNYSSEYSDYHSFQFYLILSYYFHICRSATLSLDVDLCI